MRFIKSCKFWFVEINFVLNITPEEEIRKGRIWRSWRPFNWFRSTNPSLIGGGVEKPFLNVAHSWDLGTLKLNRRELMFARDINIYQMANCYTKSLLCLPNHIFFVESGLHPVRIFHNPVSKIVEIYRIIQTKRSSIEKQNETLKLVISVQISQNCKVIIFC